MNIRVKFLVVAVCLCLGAAILQWYFHETIAAPEVLGKTPASVSAKEKFSAATEFISDDDLFRHATNVITQSPELALAIGKKLLAGDPDDENARAANLLIALCDAGQFQAALQFADDAPESSQQSWLNLIFKRWAEKNPGEAMKNLNSISDEQLRATAFRAAIDSWSENNFSSLADYAGSMPAGENRDYALNRALDNWSVQDPAGMAAWLNTAPTGVDFDRAVAEIISKTDRANRPPKIAMEWVENMNDSTLKWDAFQKIIAEWNQTDPAAAQQYIVTAPWLDDEQRQQAKIILQAPSPNVAINIGGD